MEKYQWLISLPSLIAIAIIGMFMHFFKKNVKGETYTDIKNYFRDNFKSTLTALVATIIGTLGVFFTLTPTPDHLTGETMSLLIITAFGAGYTFDSIFNKWDKQQ